MSVEEASKLSSASSSASGSSDEEDSSSSESDSVVAVEEPKVTAMSMVPRTAHEVIVEDEADMEVTVLEASQELLPLGVVQSVVKNLIVLRSISGSKPLDLDTVVATADRHVVGVIEEVIGPTAYPFYSVRRVKGYAGPALERDLELLYLLDGSNFAVPSKRRGCDASDQFDEELPENLLEFSDDEAEQEARRAKKKKNPRARKPDHLLNAQVSQAKLLQQHEKQQAYYQKTQAAGPAALYQPAAVVPGGSGGGLLPNPSPAPMGNNAQYYNPMQSQQPGQYPANPYYAQYYAQYQQQYADYYAAAAAAGHPNQMPPQMPPK